MSDTPGRDQVVVRAIVRLRIWPAVVIVLAYLVFGLGIYLFGTTNIQSFIGLVFAPLGAAALLSLWWLLASRVPPVERLVGYGLVCAALAGVVLAQKSHGMMLLAYAAPATMVGAVVVLAVTSRMQWSRQRWVVFAFLVACAGAFAAMRVDSVSGNLAPTVSWRWSPTDEDRSQSLPPLGAQRTAAVPAQAGPGDWPGFRGPARDSIVRGTTFSTDWNTPPKEIWRRKIGPAWSSFTVVGDYLFTQEQRGDGELVTCYLAATGEPVWANRVDARYEDTMGLGPRATPTFFDGKLYTLGATGILQCIDASTGNTIWKRDIAADAEAKVPGWGYSGSPLVAGDYVVAFPCGGEGKSVVAYKRATGDVAWLGGHGTGTYSSPHLATLAGVPQVLMAGNRGLQSLALETGASLWDHEWKIPTNPRCTQPLLVDENLVMFGATGTSGSRLLNVEKQGEDWKVDALWTTKKFRPYFNDCVLHKGYCYGFDGSRFACIDIKTGERMWEGKRYDGQVLLLADMDTLLVISEAGEVVLLEATPERFKEIASFKALSGKTWNHPVVAHGRLFVRNAEEAACFDLAAVPAQPRQAGGPSASLFAVSATRRPSHRGDAPSRVDRALY